MADEPNASSAFDLGALGRKLREEQDGTKERAAYLEKLRRQIKAGEYKVDSHALADRLLQRAADEILPDRKPDPRSDQRPEPDEEAK
jgi:anti-sigma28 factor (negative regulator of flagellin synthesis)